MEAAHKAKVRIVLLAAAAAVVAAVGIGFALVDSMLTRKARTQAEELSQKLERKIEVGSISTTLLTGLGAKVSAVTVGPGPGEKETLASVGRIEVKVALLRALFSGGKRIEVRSAEVQDLVVNAVRYPDGTTNLERLQERLAKAFPPEPEGPAKKQNDLSAVRVDHAALKDGRFAFIDRSGQGKAELAVRHVDLTVNDLRAGAPLEVVLQAAVLAEKQNLVLRLAAAPLPKTLIPTPEHLTLKVEPIDLSPLAPFLSRSVGLEAGRLDADLDAELGGLVPGGNGVSRVRGTLHALGLRFAGASEGKPLDVVLESDVKADTARGDLQLDKLKLDLGPAGISGKGRVQGLASSAPRIEGLEIDGHDLDPTMLAGYFPPLAKGLGKTVQGPIGLSVRGSGTQAAPQVEARLDFTPVKLAFPETLAKAAGAPMAFAIRLAGAEQGALRFELHGDLAGVDLRPGLVLDKKPGDRLQLDVAGVRRLPGGEKQHVEVSNVALRVLGDEIAGKATVDLEGGRHPKKRFQATLQGQRLDLDRLLIETKVKKEKPPLDPKTFEGLEGTAELRLAHIIYKKQAMDDAVVVATLEGDRLTLQTAQLKAFAGTVTASGTTLQLAHPKTPFHVIAKLQGLQLDQATRILSSSKVLGGKLDSEIDLKGEGQLAAQIKRSLAGSLHGNLADGVFYGKDLVGSVTAALSRALPAGLAARAPRSGVTELGKDLPLGLTFENGQAKLKGPITLKLADAEATFTGGISLDGKLDLPATLKLSPALISQLTGGRAKLSGPVPVKLRLLGAASSPQVSDLDLREAIATIGKNAVAGAVSRAIGIPAPADAERAARDAAQREQEKARRSAEQKARDAASDKLKGIFGR